MNNKKRSSNFNKNTIKTNNNIKKSPNPKIKSKNIQKSHNIFELNTLPYKHALNKNKRSYCGYYSSLLKIKNLLIFAFCPIKDFLIYRFYFLI